MSLLSGCVARPDAAAVSAIESGQYGQSRSMLRAKVDLGKPARDAEKDYVLHRLRLGLATLADGYAFEGQSPLDRVYEVVRAQGVNKDAGFASVVLNEDLKIWKGEPFEQALTLHYIALHYAQQGSWDNARAAEIGTLLPLRNVTRKPSAGADPKISVDPEPVSRSPGEVARDKGVDQEIGSYVLEKTNFTLGYVMAGIACQQMGRVNGDTDRYREAEDNFAQALKLRPDLKPLIEELRANRYNTVLVIDYGRGPQKIGTGPDESVAGFRTLTSSDNRAVWVDAARQSASYPWVCDVNAMSQDHRWNDLQELRVAKSVFGTVMVAGGAGTLGYGASRGDPTLAAIGAGLLVAGALAKAGSHADTRYCELMPQRVYVVPLTLPAERVNAQVQVASEPGSRLVLAGVSAPAGGAAQLRYVRLSNAARYATWPTSGQICYANDFAPGAGRVPLPFILGGDCVRVPSEAALADYHRAGFLLEMTTPSEIEQLYREEGICYTIQDEEGTPEKHVLENGRSLLCPYPGTLGYARLFGQVHPPYLPRSPRVAQLAAQLRERVAAYREKAGPPSATSAVPNAPVNNTPGPVSIPPPIQKPHR